MKRKTLLFAGVTAVVCFQLIQVSYASTSLFAYNTKWYPNPSWNGGLNTVITFNRFFSFENIFLQNQTFYATVNGTTYYLNVTSGSNVQITLYNWFDPLGTCLRVDRACTITLYVASKGNPSKVNGASYVYHGSNQTIDLTVSGKRYVGVHWDTGGSVYLENSDRRGYLHSFDNYKTVYGFGIMKGGYWQYAFYTRIYCKNGRNDINTVSLKLGENVTLTYNDANHKISESDPNDYVQVSQEWFPEGHPSAWVNYDSTTKYLDVGFNTRFLHLSGNESIPHYWFMKYTPKMSNENATVTVSSDAEGTIINEQPSIFYIGVAELPFPEPIYIAWELSYLFLGFGGMFLMMFATTYGVYKVKKGEIPEGIGWGVVLFMIGMCLIIVWLWR